MLSKQINLSARRRQSPQFRTPQPLHARVGSKSAARSVCSISKHPQFHQSNRIQSQLLTPKTQRKNSFLDRKPRSFSTGSAPPRFVTHGKKIVAVARNYQEHAKELNNPVPGRPLVFIKPTSSYLHSGKIELPAHCQVHHEVELGVVISKKATNVPAAKAMDYVSGYTVALDLTARNVQSFAKERGHPWAEAKGFDHFCPIGDFVEKSKVADPHNLEVECWVNAELKQKGNTRQMIFDIPRLIQHISSIMTLEENDVILTGTPEGVGHLKPGDKIACKIQDVGSFEFDAVERQYPKDIPVNEIFGDFINKN